MLIVVQSAQFPMEDDDKVRITVTIDRRSAEKVAELAQRMNASQSKMASMLLEAGLEDHEWIIRLVTSRVVTGLRDALGMWNTADDDQKRVVK
jgi:hypothetical protein